MKNTIEVLIKKPYESFKICQIDNSQTTFSEIIDGHIDIKHINDNIVAIFNKEGKLLEMPANIKIINDDCNEHIIVGNIIIAGVNEQGYYTSLNVEQKDYLKRLNLI